ncbi:hypothetical protein [Glycomyces paridis]|uniref:Uncharacterized protein n=1 Tax=Glycomyces paridis TaxID=2126555 RepID=A0A4S8PHF5_9ACTN|nr:hypothetical protein [Glycomyces paridis]THV30020.1 hypothetical protein E9998_06450 [Glycomyces paridis]
MWRTSIIAAGVLALTACAQPGESADEAAPPSMPLVTFSVTETDENLNVVMEATVAFAPDGTWHRTGTETASGALTEDQVAEIAELVEAEDFPVDPEDDTVCPAVMPDYAWSLTAGDDKASNGNGGCASSDSAVAIVEIIQDAADVGPTLPQD